MLSSHDNLQCLVSANGIHNLNCWKHGCVNHDLVS